MHTTVLLKESIAGLNICRDGIYLDATVGYGGHSQGILSQLSEKGRLYAFDKDAQAIAHVNAHIKDHRFICSKLDLADMKSFFEQNKLLNRIDGVLMDLGVSTPQLSQGNRGFSFSVDGPLDMRMDQTQPLTVADWLSRASQQQIATVLKDYGEEKQAKKIARTIKEYQNQNRLESTLQLANLISQVVPYKKGKHPATRSFQALRIFINDELRLLQQGLMDVVDVLKTGGRLCVISFHSLEDRIVKRVITPPQPYVDKHLPALDVVCVFKRIEKIKPSKLEVQQNHNSRSALLRVAEKIY